jgi:hypothetical protein
MLKTLNKENLLKVNFLDLNKYNSDYVYKIIKRNKIPYNTLNKDSILNLVINHDKNLKSGKLDSQLLKNKTNRKKYTRQMKFVEESLKIGQNMYEEKVVKRRMKNEFVNQKSRRESSRRSSRISNIDLCSIKMAKSKKLVLKKQNIKEESIQNRINKNEVLLCKISL